MFSDVLLIVLHSQRDITTLRTWLTISIALGKLSVYEHQGIQNANLNKTKKNLETCITLSSSFPSFNLTHEHTGRSNNSRTLNSYEAVREEHYLNRRGTAKVKAPAMHSRHVASPAHSSRCDSLQWKGAVLNLFTVSCDFHNLFAVSPSPYFSLTDATKSSSRVALSITYNIFFSNNLFFTVDCL